MERSREHGQCIQYAGVGSREHDRQLKVAGELRNRWNASESNPRRDPSEIEEESGDKGRRAQAPSGRGVNPNKENEGLNGLSGSPHVHCEDLAN